MAAAHFKSRCLSGGTVALQGSSIHKLIPHYALFGGKRWADRPRVLGAQLRGQPHPQAHPPLCAVWGQGVGRPRRPRCAPFCDGPAVARDCACCCGRSTGLTAVPPPSCHPRSAQAQRRGGGALLAQPPAALPPLPPVPAGPAARRRCASRAPTCCPPPHPRPCRPSGAEAVRFSRTHLLPSPSPPSLQAQRRGGGALFAHPPAAPPGGGHRQHGHGRHRFCHRPGQAAQLGRHAPGVCGAMRTGAWLPTRTQQAVLHAGAKKSSSGRGVGAGWGGRDPEPGKRLIGSLPCTCPACMAGGGACAHGQGGAGGVQRTGHHARRLARRAAGHQQGGDHQLQRCVWVGGWVGGRLAGACEQRRPRCYARARRARHRGASRQIVQAGRGVCPPLPRGCSCRQTVQRPCMVPGG